VADKIEQILDECIDRMNSGESLEACLAAYPEYANQIEPLLKTMFKTQNAYLFEPSDDSVRAARLRFYNALDKQRKSLWQRLFSRRLALAVVVSVLIIIVGAYFGLKTISWQSPAPVILVSAPSVEGNFVFLVSDEVNAIADFSSLNASVTRVSLQQLDNSSRRVEFSPEVPEFDLTLLPGEVTQQIWRGNVPPGWYSDVVIHLSGVNGVLKSSGQKIVLKLPSNKLSLSVPFEVSSEGVTSFTYDLTVIKTGKAQNGKHILKPQVDQSGAKHVPVWLPDKNKPGPKK
jgi:hypothetical protein